MIVGILLTQTKMKKAKRIILFIGVSVFLFSCGNNAGNGTLEGGSNSGQTSTNSEGIKNSSDFKTVKISNQEWVAENLNVSNFRNGDPIPEAKTNDEWIKANEKGEPTWCYYDNDPENGEKYGKLYNWYAVNDPRGLAPIGWHVPSDAEWTQLTDYLGGNNLASTKMKSARGWEINGNGTNESGFSGLPGGSRYPTGLFGNIGSYGSWWSFTEDDSSNAWYRYLSYYGALVYRYLATKENGFAVRCLRD